MYSSECFFVLGNTEDPEEGGLISNEEEHSSSLKVTIVCGIHGSHMVRVLECLNFTKPSFEIF